MAIGMVTFPSVFAEFAAACGRPAAAAAERRLEVPSVEPTADGWVNFTTNTPQQFADLCTLLGRPELAADRRFARHLARFKNRREFAEVTEGYTRTRTTEQVVEEAALLRIPVAPVLDDGTVLTFGHFAERGVFVDNPSGAFRQPRIPYRLHGLDPRPFGPVPRPGQHDEEVEWPQRPPRPAGPPGRLPLEGVRVVDFTAWWAGPGATQLLACLGADVVKVESTVRPDQIRFAGPKVPGDPQWWEWGPLAHAVNTNKRGITVDLSRPEGIEVVLALLGRADLAFENFTPRVMGQFGLDWARLEALNPRLSLVRMPAFGLDGPWRDRPGFAQTMEAVSGLAAATGWADGPPVLVGGTGDPVAALHAAFAGLVALAERDRSGRGHLVEATMIEAVLNVAAAAPIARQLTGVPGDRRGNRSQDGAVAQGVYRGAADDSWLAVTVRDDGERRRLEAVFGGALPTATDGESPPAPPGGGEDLETWLAARCRGSMQPSWPNGWRRPASPPRWWWLRPRAPATPKSSTAASSRPRTTRSPGATASRGCLSAWRRRRAGCGPRPRCWASTTTRSWASWGSMRRAGTSCGPSGSSARSRPSGEQSAGPQARAARTARPSPERSAWAPLRPPMARSSETIGPVTVGPSPTDQAVSVARSDNPAIRRFAPMSRLDLFQLSATATRASSGTSWWRPRGRRMSSPWTTISPSMATTGAGGWLVVEVRARSRRTSSSGPTAARRSDPRAVKTSNLKPAASSSL